jgi:hypothetical protein
MKVYIEPGASGNLLSTVAIGGGYLDVWERNAFPTWTEYCHRHDLGLVVFDQEMLAKESSVWKKANWQKLLIGDALEKSRVAVKNVCYLDTDILISPLAPNVFEGYDPSTIALVSQVNGLPQPLHSTLRRLAFLRHTHLDSKYPLDSALFMSPRQIFEFHGVAEYDDYVCTGFFVFNVSNHGNLLKGWFDKYQKGLQTITGGGEEPHLNYELQTWGRIAWMPYEFQALWTYEAAWRFPFLFSAEARSNENLVRQCIEASLYANHFLHFAGSWHECQMWKIGGFFAGTKQRDELEAYRAYLATPVTGQPQGMTRP